MLQERRLDEGPWAGGFIVPKIEWKLKLSPRENGKKERILSLVYKKK